jgi:hypothetical protein
MWQRWAGSVSGQAGRLGTLAPCEPIVRHNRGSDRAALALAGWSVGGYPSAPIDKLADGKVYRPTRQARDQPKCPVSGVIGSFEALAGDRAKSQSMGFARTYNEKRVIILDSFLFNYTPTHTHGVAGGGRG